MDTQVRDQHHSLESRASPPDRTGQSVGAIGVFPRDTSRIANETQHARRNVQARVSSGRSKPYTATAFRERKLPPAKVVLIVLAVLLVILAIYGFVGRAKPQGAGSVDSMVAVEVPGQNSMLVAITVTLHNSGEKPLWIHTIKGKLKTASQEYSDDAASAVDFDRYFQAFPALKQSAQSALMPETKVLPGNEAHGTVIVSFPVNQDDFNKRQSLSVEIQPYDQPLPVVLTK